MFDLQVKPVSQIICIRQIKLPAAQDPITVSLSVEFVAEFYNILIN